MSDLVYDLAQQNYMISVSTEYSNRLLRSQIFLHVIVVDKFSEMSNSVCVGQPVNGDERVILFIKTVKGKRYNVCVLYKHSH